MFTDVYDEQTASRAAKAMVKAVERALGGAPVDWTKLMRRVPEGEEWELMDWARRRLEALPVPIANDVPDEAAHERGVLERFVAEIYAWEGNPEYLIRVLRRDLLERGQSAAELILLLKQVGRDMEAWVLAKHALAVGADDTATIRRLQARLAAVPEGWAQAVEALATQPTREAWQTLMSFVPEDNLFFTMQHTVHLLVDLGADPDAIFEAAVADGATSSLLELVDTGLVDPEVVARHAEQSALPAFWLALAARSALVRGDPERCVALAARALRWPGDTALASVQLGKLWADASDALRAQLAEVGVKPLRTVVSG